ncbi:hypothetical protein FACS189490_01910 [Clostridia bacterium]|nr:hypothetical protein FACS189490_01910 [Clostridia bacterium]
MNICFTGYRPEKSPFSLERENPRLRELRIEIKAAIYEAAKGGAVFYCGMARGFDIIAAKIVLELKKEGLPVQLFCVLPFSGYTISGGVWGKRYAECISSADKIVMVCSGYSKYSFLKRDDYMVAHSERIIAFYRKEIKGGGTEYTVKKAVSKGIIITVV